MTATMTAPDANPGAENRPAEAETGKAIFLFLARVAAGAVAERLSADPRHRTRLHRRAGRTQRRDQLRSASLQLLQTAAQRPVLGTRSGSASSGPCRLRSCSSSPPLGLALLLNTTIKFRGVARTIALIPWAMPPVVVAIMWRLLLHPTNGPVNEILQNLHLTDHPINFLGNFSTALPAVIVVGIWVGMPMTTVTLLAGLQGIDRTLYEAAAVDGAGAWSQFWNITLPQLRTVIVAITSLD
jgi:hypothetical protein